MIRMFRCLFVTSALAASLPAVAYAQGAPNDSLSRRIDVLERRLLELEQRIRDLETIVASGPSRAQNAPVSSQSRDLANWRRLRTNMTMDQVRDVLGEPERVDNLGTVTLWHWESIGASVTFGNRSNKVTGWSEPRR